MIYKYQPIGAKAASIMVKNAVKYCLYKDSGGSFTVIARVDNGLSSVKLLINLYADGIREIITDKKTPKTKIYKC